MSKYPNEQRLYDLSDVMPAKYHLTVPANFRKYNAPPKNLVLHFGNLYPHEVLEFEGFKVTTPEKTIYDVLLDDRIPEEFVMQTILDGLAKGVISKSRLISVTEPLKSDRVQRIMNEVEKK